MFIFILKWWFVLKKRSRTIVILQYDYHHFFVTVLDTILDYLHFLNVVLKSDSLVFYKRNSNAIILFNLDGIDNTELFYMDPQTARVYLREWLDFETKSDYVLTIQVTDNGFPERRSSTTLLNIHVKDVNDNQPVSSFCLLVLFVCLFFHLCQTGKSFV